MRGLTLDDLERLVFNVFSVSECDVLLFSYSYSVLLCVIQIRMCNCTIIPKLIIFSSDVVILWKIHAIRKCVKLGNESVIHLITWSIPKNFTNLAQRKKIKIDMVYMDNVYRPT